MYYCVQHCQVKMFWVLVFVAFVLLFYYFLLKPQLYWKERNVPQVFSAPIFGSLIKLMLHMETPTQMLKRIYNSFQNSRYVGMYQLGSPTLLLRDPALIRQITVKDFEHFLDHRIFTTPNEDPIFSRNLFQMKGEAWKEMRATLSPSFTTSKMRSLFLLMEQNAVQYVNYYLNQKKDITEVELKDSLSRYGNDVIANCGFGVTVDSLRQPDNEFYTRGKHLASFNTYSFNLKFLINLISPKLTRFLKLSLFPKSDFFTYIIGNSVRIRKEQNIVRPDMIHILMEAHKNPNKIGKNGESDKQQFTTKAELTDEDMAAQAIIFFLAGFDTVSNMISFLFYELALNPDVQKKLIKEIDDTRKEHNAKLTYDVLNELKYLDMVLHENLRKNPPLLLFERECTKPYTILPEKPGEVHVDIKQGDYIWLPVVALHNDEELYPNPSKFDPERFSDENKDKIVPYSYIPFGSGPRACIGSRFARMEAKVLIYHVLSHFELTVIDRTRVPLQMAINIFLSADVEDGIWVGLKRRLQL